MIWLCDSKYINLFLAGEKVMCRLHKENVE